MVIHKQIKKRGFTCKRKLPRHFTPIPERGGFGGESDWYGKLEPLFLPETFRGTLIIIVFFLAGLLKDLIVSVLLLCFTPSPSLFHICTSSHLFDIPLLLSTPQKPTISCAYSLKHLKSKSSINTQRQKSHVLVPGTHER